METRGKAAEKRGAVCNRSRKEVSKKVVLNYIEIGLSATATSKIANEIR